jgi:hypothetical protein
MKFGPPLPPKKTRKKRFTSIDVKYFRRKAGYTLLDHKCNEEILER